MGFQFRAEATSCSGLKEWLWVHGFQGLEVFFIVLGRGKRGVRGVKGQRFGGLAHAGNTAEE